MTSGQLNQVLRQLCRLVGARSVEELSDRQLLEAFIGQHDPAAFEVLVQRHGPLVLGVCRRVLQDEHDADDAFQACFMVLARKATSIRRQESVASWLCGTAYRISLKARAAASRRREQERQAGPMPPPLSENESLWRELRPILDEELNRLPEKYRAPLVLCYLQGKTNEAAARELGWPPGSMSYRLAQARERLRARLVQRGVALSAPALASLLADNALAAVQAPLVDATVRASVAFAAGEAAALAGVAAPIVALAEAGVQAIMLAKLKLAAAISLAVILVAGTAGIVYRLGSSATFPATAPAPLDSRPRCVVQFSNSQRFGIACPLLRDPRDPDRPKLLTREPKGLTNNTCFRIDGLEYLFGIEVPGVRWTREKGKTIKEVKTGDYAWESAIDHDNSKVRIVQLVELVRGEHTGLLDTVLVRYEVSNLGTEPRTVGLRMLLDTFIGHNDAVPFLIPPTDRASGQLLDTLGIFDRDSMPDFARALETDNLEDKNATVAELSLKLRGAEALERLVVCRWPGNSEMRWAWPYQAMNEPADQPKDSCAVLYWAERRMQPKEKRVLAFAYGLGQTYSVGGGQSKGRLALMTGGSAQVGKVFTATAYIKNFLAGQLVKLVLPAALALEPGQKLEQAVPAAGPQGYAQVSWRVRSPKKPGTYKLKVDLGNGFATLEREIRVSATSMFD